MRAITEEWKTVKGIPPNKDTDGGVDRCDDTDLASEVKTIPETCGSGKISALTPGAGEAPEWQPCRDKRGKAINIQAFPSHSAALGVVAAGKGIY